MNTPYRSPRRHHVLLAEDDDELRRLLAEALRASGHDVSEVADGGRFLVCVARALSKRRSDRPVDLIVSDVRMPVCTGLQIVEALRQAHWRTPVIFVTAFADESTRTRAGKLMAHLVDKPFDVDDLMALVAKVLSDDQQRLPVSTT